VGRAEAQDSDRNCDSILFAKTSYFTHGFCSGRMEQPIEQHRLDSTSSTAVVDGMYNIYSFALFDSQAYEG